MNLLLCFTHFVDYRVLLAHSILQCFHNELRWAGSLCPASTSLLHKSFQRQVSVPLRRGGVTPPTFSMLSAWPSADAWGLWPCALLNRVQSLEHSSLTSIFSPLFFVHFCPCRPRWTNLHKLHEKCKKHSKISKNTSIGLFSLLLHVNQQLNSHSLSTHEPLKSHSSPWAIWEMSLTPARLFPCWSLMQCPAFHLCE